MADRPGLYQEPDNYFTGGSSTASGASRRTLRGGRLDTALNAILVAEKDVAAALQKVEEMATAAQKVPRLMIKISVAAQITALEARLEALVEDLRWRKRIVGTPLTVEEILNPPEELEIGENPYKFDGDAEIVAAAKHQLAVEHGEITVIEIDSDEEEEDDNTPQATSGEVRSLCEKLEALCVGHGGSLELQTQLRQFRGALR
ncbi:hypothetical protein C8F04DRAFT_1288388 [Mycena alexandri]|uniref:Uncharacterized protein n=1 Tax=Mycena alexandri TaxID=1745969 RepID=A0AAD6SK58_9AGAR|nr:hypothetical protein C8F04DRAFT_1288388 [Mycena alexandri]